MTLYIIPKGTPAKIRRFGTVKHYDDIITTKDNVFSSLHAGYTNPDDEYFKFNETQRFPEYDCPLKDVWYIQVLKEYVIVEQ